MLRPLMAEEFKDTSLEDLAIEYQYTTDPCVLASAFNKVYLMSIQLGKKYMSVKSDDLASITLNNLDKCLQIFDHSKNVKFSTYFHNVLENALKTELATNSRDKRAINQNTVELDANTQVDSGIDVLEELVPPGILSDREMKMCRMFADGYTVSDIAKEFEVCYTRATKIKYRLAQKLSYLLG